MLHPQRHRVVGWIGGWALVTGLLGGLTAFALPVLAGSVTGWDAVEIGVRSASSRLIAPAAVTGMVGVGLLAVAAFGARRDGRRLSQEGAAAALGVDEPAAWDATASPTLDLAARGLVDVNHPLTNI